MRGRMKITTVNNRDDDYIITFIFILIRWSTRPSIFKYLFDLFKLLLVLDHVIPLWCHQLELHFSLLNDPLLVFLLHVPSHKVKSHAIVEVLLLLLLLWAFSLCDLLLKLVTNLRFGHERHRIPLLYGATLSRAILRKSALLEIDIWGEASNRHERFVELLILVSLLLFVLHLLF